MVYSDRGPPDELQQDRLKGEHCRERGDRGHRNGSDRGLPKGFGEELSYNHPGHCPGCEPERCWKNSLESVDEEKCRHRQQWLRKAREDAPTSRRANRGPARDENEADREALGDVVNRDRNSDQDPQGFSAAEGRSDTDSLGDGVNGHHGDDEERLYGVVSAKRTELELAMRRVQEARDDEDEDDACGNTDGRTSTASMACCEDETGACAKHHATRRRIRDAQGVSAVRAGKEERQRAEAGSERREKRRDEDREDIDLSHCRTLTTWRKTRTPPPWAY